MTFEKALAELKKGKAIKRKGSNLVYFLPHGSNTIYFFDLCHPTIKYEVRFFQPEQILDETWEITKLI